MEDQLGTDRPSGADPDAAIAAADLAAADAGSEPTPDGVDEAALVTERAALAPDDPGDTAFAEHLDPAIRDFGAPKPQAVVCQWCNEPLGSDDPEVCPHCGSRLKPTEENLLVPGVTTLSSEAARALELAEIQRNRAAAKSGQAMYTTPRLATAEAVIPAPDEATIEAANRPPDDEVRRVMLELELEARQAKALADARAVFEARLDAGASAAVEVDTATDDATPAVDAEAAGNAAAEPDDASAETRSDT